MPVFLLSDILHAHSSLGLYVGIVSAIICVCFVEGGIIYMLIGVMRLNMGHQILISMMT
jgi:hypothetical protein